jgi:hypothetical protein
MTTSSGRQTPSREKLEDNEAVTPSHSPTHVRRPCVKATKLFAEILLKVNSFAVAERVWERVLSETQRGALGNSVLAALRDHCNTVGMWRYHYQVSYQRAVIDIGEKVGFLSSSDVDWLLREGGDLPRSPAEAMEEAIRRGYLVIIRESREVYWKDKMIDGDWWRYNESWEFFTIACEQALQNKPIDRLSFGARAAENIVTKKKNRLMQQIPHFPSDLYDAYVSAGRGTQRFNVPAHQIYFFDHD